MKEVIKDFEILKNHILERYDFLFITDSLINGSNYYFTNRSIQFNKINIFCEYNALEYKGIPDISIRIDSLDIKIQEFLKSENIEFEVRDDIMNTDIYIEELTYEEESTRIVLNILDFFYKNYLHN